MTDTQQTEAMRLADRIKSSGQFTNLGELDAAAAELHCLHAENVALQQCYDAARLEIDHLRGVTKMVAPSGEYPPLPRPFIFAHESGGVEWPDTFDATQMRTYADATCAMRAQADSQPAPVLGTIAHVGTGKTTLTGAITSALRAASTEADNVTAPAGATSNTHWNQAPCAQGDAQQRAMDALSSNARAPADSQPVPTRAFLERTLAAMEGVIDVADRQTDEFEALHSCIIDLTVLLFSKSAPARDYPPLPMQFACSGVFPVYSADQMRAYVDADRAARAPADSVLEDAAFEAVRKKLCALLRYSFFSDGYGAVRRVPDKSGSWIAFDDVHALFDPVAVDAARKQGANHD